MKNPSEFEIKLPDGLCAGTSIESWLAQVDARPTIIPRWPESLRMSLVAVINEDMDTAAEAVAKGFVLVKQGQADDLCDFTQGLDRTGVLFFRVSRQWLLDSGAVPDLTPLDWD